MQNIQIQFLCLGSDESTILLLSRCRDSDVAVLVLSCGRSRQHRGFMTQPLQAAPRRQLFKQSSQSPPRRHADRLHPWALAAGQHFPIKSYMCRQD